MSVEWREDVKVAIRDFRQNGIRVDTKKVVEFQDLVMTKSFNEISSMYKSFDRPDRELFIWSCTCCLGFDSALQIIKSTIVSAEREGLYNELDEEWSRVNAEAYEFTHEKWQMMEEAQRMLRENQTLYDEQERLNASLQKSFTERKELREEIEALNDRIRYLEKLENAVNTIKNW